MEWIESQPFGDYYTLLRLSWPNEVSHRALAEFWRGILTQGRQRSKGWDWHALTFRLGIDTISAWFSDRTHVRLVPLLFEFVCPAMEREYDRLPQANGDVTDEAFEQFQTRYCQHLLRSAAISPVPQLLSDWRQEREIKIEAELYDGWRPLDT